MHNVIYYVLTSFVVVVVSWLQESRPAPPAELTDKGGRRTETLIRPQPAVYVVSSTTLLSATAESVCTQTACVDVEKGREGTWKHEVNLACCLYRIGAGRRCR